MNAIEVDGVEKRFGPLHVLRGLRFAVPAGQRAILLGANGCGKSTLMRCLNGLARPDAGAIRVGGEDVGSASGRRLARIRRGVGVVFQRFNLVSNMSVFQNVLYGAVGRHRTFFAVCGPLASDPDREYAMHCLERVGLAGRAGQRADQLSGGQQQRVAIARMLMQKPSVVLADEPVASLDPKAAREIMVLLSGVAAEQGLTLLCTLHQLDFAEEFGDRLVGMKAGAVEIDRALSNVARAEMEALYEGQVRVDDVSSHAPSAGLARAS